MASYLLGATMLWGMFYSFQREFSAAFMEELWSHNLLNIFSTPLNITEYVTGLVVLNLFKALLGLLVAAIVAWFCYANDFALFLPGLLPFLLVLILFALSVGLVITGLIIRFTTKIQTLAWSFAGFLMPFSCVFYPATTLPDWLRPVAWALPTMHAFEGMRQMIDPGIFSHQHWVWGISLSLVYLACALTFFHWMFKLALARGFLAKQE
jgi:ABC-2 type transport system permease protein